MQNFLSMYQPTFSTEFSTIYPINCLSLPMNDRGLEICKKKLLTFSTDYHHIQKDFF